MSRFKHIPTNSGGKQDCPRKATKESIRNYKSSKLWDNIKEEKENKKEPL
jgi:hypothetical protein